MGISAPKDTDHPHSGPSPQGQFLRRASRWHEPSGVPRPGADLPPASLGAVLAEYLDHYNGHRPLRAGVATKRGSGRQAASVRSGCCRPGRCLRRPPSIMPLAVEPWSGEPWSCGALRTRWYSRRVSPLPPESGARRNPVILTRARQPINPGNGGPTSNRTVVQVVSPAHRQCWRRMKSDSARSGRQSGHPARPRPPSPSRWARRPPSDLMGTVRARGLSVTPPPGLEAAFETGAGLVVSPEEWGAGAEGVHPAAGAEQVIPGVLGGRA